MGFTEASQPRKRAEIFAKVGSDYDIVKSRVRHRCCCLLSMLVVVVFLICFGWLVGFVSLSVFFFCFFFVFFLFCFVLGFFVFCFFCCPTFQHHADVSQGRICSDNCTWCKTDLEVADRTISPRHSILASGQPVPALTL